MSLCVGQSKTKRRDTSRLDQGLGSALPNSQFVRASRMVDQGPCSFLLILNIVPALANDWEHYEEEFNDPLGESHEVCSRRQHRSECVYRQSPCE